MTAEKYLAGLEALGLSQVGAAPLWGVSPRTAQSYAANGPPKTVAMALELLLRFPKEERDRFVATMIRKGSR